mmetsp:Transcript_26363/g.60735  ORF Transcript_26363/g.60735 Transcript_26363/m.60735 type:complete len:206 (-) Transcript_26363:283-900(-)
MSVGSVQRKHFFEGEPLHHVDGGEAFGAEPKAGVGFARGQVHRGAEAEAGHQVLDGACAKETKKNTRERREDSREGEVLFQHSPPINLAIWGSPTLSSQVLLICSSLPFSVSRPPMRESSQLDLNCHTPSCVSKSAPRVRTVFSGRNRFRSFSVVRGSVRTFRPGNLSRWPSIQPRRADGGLGAAPPDGTRGARRGRERGRGRPS